MDSLMVLAVEQRQKEALWSVNNCPSDVAEWEGFVNTSMACYLCYFPIVRVAVHGVFFMLIVAQYVRSQIKPGKESEQKQLAHMHRGAKFLCIGILLLDIVRCWWLSSSKTGLVLGISNAVAWLTFSIALQQEEVKGQVIYGSIMRSWWLAFLNSSAVGFITSVATGRILDAGFDSVPLISLLFLVIISFSGHMYRNRVGQVEGFDSANESLLRESLPEETVFPVVPSGSGFSKAGLLSVVTFFWLNPLLAVGNKRPLRIQDVPLLDPIDAPETNYKAFEEQWQQQSLETPPGTVPSLRWTLFKTFWRPFMFSFLLIILLVLAQFIAPLLQNQLIKFMEAEHRTFKRGLILVLILLSGKIAESVFNHQLVFRSRKLGLRMWAGVGCAVYRKSLRLSVKARHVRSVGEITNIISADLQRLLDLTYYIQQGLVIPLQLIVAVVILFEVVGVAMIAGLSSLVLVLVINSLIIRRMRSYRARMLLCKDKRMRATTECLGNLKVIKLQTWDDMFKERIEGIREEERSWIQKFMYTWGNAIHMVWNGPLVLSAVTFCTMVLLGEQLTADRVYTALTTFKIIQEPIRFIPDIIANLIQSLVSLQRIGAFLMEDEVDEDAVERNSEDSEYAVEIDSAAFAWDKMATERALKDLNLKIKKGSCVAICGAVGSGKSSLLYCIVGELPRLAGTAKLSGRLAFVAQSAWIQNNTIKENILFGRAMDPDRYKEAVRVSGLVSDLAQFPDGDETEIGERGTTLSGGQKQRVQLARAVYQDADVYVLDDPFSAVDAHTGTFLFEQYVLGALKGKTVILVTHQVEFLPAVDQIIVMRAPGEIVQKGTYNELVREGKDFGAFVDALQESLHNVNQASHTSLDGDVEMETLLDNMPDEEPFYHFSPAGNNTLEGNAGMEIVLDSMSEARVPLVKGSSGNQKALVAQSSSPRRKSLSKSGSARTSDVVGTGKQTKGKLIQEEIREVGRVDKKVIWSYLSKVGKGIFWCLVLVPQTTTTTLSVCSDLWLASGTSTGKPTSLRFMLIYILLLTGCSLSVFTRARLVAWTGVATAQAFFIGMLNSIIRAPMSFIDSTPVGRILSRVSFQLPEHIDKRSAGANVAFDLLLGYVVLTIGILHYQLLHICKFLLRGQERLEDLGRGMDLYVFIEIQLVRRRWNISRVTLLLNVGMRQSSTDQSALDVELPFLTAAVSNNLIGVLGTLIVTTYVTPQILFLTLPLGILFVRLQMYYINSSRELSRLTALTEAPMFLHISESVGGATTIRAFEAQSRFAATNALRLEAYERSYFHNISAGEWLGFRLDCFSTTLLSGVAILLITLPKDTIAPGLAGMSLSYGLSLSSVLMRLTNAVSYVENRMVSVERIMQYSNIPSEAPSIIPGRRPASGWPNEGRIEFQQLQIRYRPDLPMVLKGLSCVIRPREKVGVVGRTGSGKSTLVQALFRLTEPASGHILIDGLDTSTIGLHDLRSALGVIPQEPTLFEGTIRSNLDPFDSCSDPKIWESLDKCQLGQVVREKPDKLNSAVSEQGENWSVGERQLLCLARALLKHARILVLDEATASVDITTDAVIQHTIKEYFAECTVISVAHRIPTVIDSDRVLVLDQGLLMENNSPEQLLTDENSMFSKLVKEYTSRTEGSNNLEALVQQVPAKLF